jgi:HK97 family phage major capsid protein
LPSCAEARAEFDALQLKCAELDGDVLRVKALETIQLATATPVTEVVNTDPLVATDVRAGNSGIISVRQNLAEGIPMARWAMALVRARGNLSEALAATQHNRIWMDTSPQLALTLKAAVAAGDTTTAGWASELVYVNNLSSEFIEFLRPATILGKLPGLTRVPFNMRVAGQNAGSSSHWVGQGQPVTVSKLGTTSVLLGMAKAAGLVAIDEELVRSSSPTAELMVRNDLAKAIAQFLDEQFLDPSLSEVINVSPASVLHGVTPITPSGTDFVAFRADIHTMLDRFVEAKLDTTANVFIMTPSMALSISMMLNALGQQLYPNIMASGGTLLGVPVVTSMSSHFSDEDVGSVISLVNAPEILLADDGQVTITARTEASIQMVDNPSNQSTGETTATSLVSMFQTSSMAIKAVRYINWGKRRSSAAAWIKTAAYK